MATRLICLGHRSTHRFLSTSEPSVCERSEFHLHGTPMVIPRNACKKALLVLPGYQYRDSMEKACWLTKSVFSPGNLVKQQNDDEYTKRLTQSLVSSRLTIDKMDSKSDNRNIVAFMLDVIKTGIASEGKPPRPHYLDTFTRLSGFWYRCFRLFHMNLTPHLIIRGQDPYPVFSEPVVPEKSPYDIQNFDQLECPFSDIQGRRLMDDPGYKLELRDNPKLSRSIEYGGNLPPFTYPRLIVIRGRKTDFSDRFFDVYHAVRVAFLSLLTHQSSLNHSKGWGDGWGVSHGCELPTPLTTKVLVICKEEFTMIDYQLNTLQLMNNKDRWNQAWSVGSQSFLNADSTPNYDSYNFLVNLIRSVIF